MAKDLYCIVLKSLGKKHERVLEELLAFGTADSDIEVINEKIENKKAVNIAYAKTFSEATLLKERFESYGAEVDVSRSRLKRDKRLKEDGTPIYDAFCEGFEKYREKCKELHKNLAFGVIGWPLLAIGISFLAFSNSCGLISFILGVVILDISAFKLMLSNNKKKKAERRDTENVDNISTGKKVWLIILEILKYIGVILFGAFVVLYRVIKLLIKLGKIKNSYKLLMPFYETATFDILISLVIFVLFLLITYICILIAK